MFCYVSGCPNANNGSKESKKARMVQIFFSAPEDESLFKLWQSAVPKGGRIFTREDKLCDFHFKKSEVILFNETKLPNGNVRRVPASEPKLKAGTIPSIFPEQKISLNEDAKKTGSLPNSSNTEGQKLKQKRKLSSSDESDVQESPPPAPRSRGRPRKYAIGDQEKKKKPAFDKHRKQSLSESTTSLEEDLNKDYESDITNPEDVSQGMQPSIRLVPLSTLLAPSSIVPEQKPKRTVRMKSTGGPLLKKAENRKKAVGRNAVGPASAKKVKFADTELDESESISLVHPEPVKPSQERKQMRKDLNRVEEELQNAIDDMNETYEIEHVTDPGDTEHQDDEIFEIMSIKSDPDDLEHKKTLEELAAELAESGLVADTENINSSEADTMQEPRITQVISLRDLDEERHLLLKKMPDVEPMTDNYDIEREMAKMVGEGSTTHPEPLLHAENISNSETLPANDDQGVSESLINDQSAHIRTTSKPEAHVNVESSTNNISSIPEDLMNHESAMSRSCAESEASKNEGLITTTPSKPESSVNDGSSFSKITNKSEESINDKSSATAASEALVNKELQSKTDVESEVPTNDESISTTKYEPNTTINDESLNKTSSICEAPAEDESLISKPTVESDAPSKEESIGKTASEPEAPINDELPFSASSAKFESPTKAESLKSRTNAETEITAIEESSANETAPVIDKSLECKIASTEDESSLSKGSAEAEVLVSVKSLGTKNIAESKTLDSDKPLPVEGDVLTEIPNKDEILNVCNPRSEIENSKECDEIEEHSCAEFTEEDTDTVLLDKGENSKETVETKTPEESLSFVDNALCLVSSNEEFSVSKGFSEEKQTSITENIESAKLGEPCRSNAPENSIKSTTCEEINYVTEGSIDDDDAKLEMGKRAEKTTDGETLVSGDAPASDLLLKSNVSHTNILPILSEPEKSQNDLISEKRKLKKPGPRSRMSPAKNKKSEVRISKSGRKRRIKKHGESFSDEDLLSPSSPECVLDISSDSEADPNWAPNADAFEVSDDNDTDPECIGVDGDSNTEKFSKTGTESVKTSKTSEMVNITQTSKSSKPTTTVPPEVSRLLTQDTLQQILKTLKLPLDAPVSFNIGEGAAAETVFLPTETKKTYFTPKDKPISARGRPPKVHLHNENIPGKVRQSRKVQISVERSKRCEKLLGVKMFEGLGKIKKAFDFSTFLTDADDELQFKKFCLVVRECLRDVCESKNAVTNIGKLTLKISRKTMKSQMPIPDLEPLAKPLTVQLSSDANKRDSLPESTGDEAEMFECMTVDSNVENHYENPPNIENAMEEDMLV